MTYTMKRNARKTHVAAALLVLCCAGGLPGKARAQLPAHYNETVATASGPYVLDGPGKARSHTLSLARVGTSVPFQARGIRYTVTARVASASGANNVRGTVALLDAEGRVLLQGDSTAAVNTAGDSTLSVELNASYVPSASQMRISYEALARGSASVQAIRIDRQSLSQPIIDFDFGDD